MMSEEFKRLEEDLDILRQRMGFVYEKLPGKYDPVYWIKFSQGTIDGGDCFRLQVCVRFNDHGGMEGGGIKAMEALIRKRVKETRATLRSKLSKGKGRIPASKVGKR